MHSVAAGESIWNFLSFLSSFLFFFGEVLRCSVRCLVFCLFVAVEYLLPERNRQIEKERERVCVCVFVYAL